MTAADTKHATIPVFVPHYACKNACVFCDQKRISGAQKPPDGFPEPSQFREITWKNCKILKIPVECDGQSYLFFASEELSCDSLLEYLADYSSLEITTWETDGISYAQLCLPTIPVSSGGGTEKEKPAEQRSQEPGNPKA